MNLAFSRNALRSPIVGMLLRTFASGLVTLAGGCSPSTFTGDTSDARVQGLRSAHGGGTPACSSFHLAGSVMTSSDLRNLVQCFNANGSIQPLANLVAKLNDDSLAPIARALNVGVLADADVRRQSYEVLVKLQREGTLDATVASLGGLIQNADALTRIARNTVSSPIRARFHVAPVRWSNEQGFRAVDFAARALAQPSYASLRSKVLAHAGSDAETAELRRSLRAIVSTLRDSPNLRVLRAKLSARNSFRIFRTLTGPTSESFRARAPDSLRILSELTKRGGANLRTLTGLIETLETPVDCMHGGRVFTSPWTDITTEFRFHRGPALRTFVTDFAATVGLVVQDFCRVPRSFYSVFPDFYRLVGTSWGEHALEWVSLLADAGVSDPVSRLLTELEPNLRPVLSAYGEDGAVGDAFLLLSSIGDADFESLLRTSDFLTLSDPATGVADLSDSEASSIGSAIRDVLEIADPTAVGPALETALKLYQGTQSHPWFHASVNIVNAFTPDGALTPPIDLPEKEFGDAVRFVHAMSQDGRLSSLLLDFFRLFQRAGDTVPDAFIVENWDRGASFHKLAVGVDGLAPAPVSSRLTDRDAACLRIDYAKPWDAQFANYFDCLGSPRTASRSTYASVTQLNSEGLFAPFVSLFADWPWSAEEFHALLPSFSAFILSGDLGSILDGARGGFVKLVHPLSEAARSHSPAPTLAHFATWARDPGNWALVSEAIAPLGTIVEPPRATGRGPLPADAEFEAYLRGKECLSKATAVASRRAELIANSRTFIYGSSRAELSDLYAWTRGAAFPKLVAGMSAAISSGRLTSRALVDFLHANAQSPRLFSTYSAERRGLEVQLLSGLEELELLLRSANLSIPVVGNFAEKFISEIAVSWGDEPVERWPTEIRTLYPHGGAPTLAATIADLRTVLERYEGLAGLPKVRNCDGSVDFPLPPDPAHDFQPLAPLVPKTLAARLFNIHQTLPWVESQRDSGMKLVRELAFQFYRVNAVPELVELGTSGMIHAASALFAFRVDPLERSAEVRALDLLFRGSAVSGSVLTAAVTHAMPLLPTNLVTSGGGDLATATALDLGDPGLRRTIDAGLYAVASLGEAVVGDAVTALDESFTSHASEWKPELARILAPANFSKTDSASLQTRIAGIEPVARSVFAREILTRSGPGPIARVFASWSHDPAAFRFGVEVMRLTLLAPTMTSVGASKGARDRIVENARELAAFLALPPGDPRGDAARVLREQVLSDGLRGPTVARWLEFIDRDPDGAALALGGLFNALSGEDFKAFLITAGRQLPH